AHRVPADGLLRSPCAHRRNSRRDKSGARAADRPRRRGNRAASRGCRADRVPAPNGPPAPTGATPQSRAAKAQSDRASGKFAAITWVYAEIVRQLAKSEVVSILVNDAKTEQRVKRVLRKSGAPIARFDFYHVPTDRVWTRDYCPIFVVEPSGEVALTDWH